MPNGNLVEIIDGKRLAQRLASYGRLLELTTDQLARAAIEHERTRLAERLRESELVFEDA